MVELWIERSGMEWRGTSENRDYHRVSSLVLKISVDEAFTISAGNLFQYGTARKLKARWRRWVLHLYLIIFWKHRNVYRVELSYSQSPHFRSLSFRRYLKRFLSNLCRLLNKWEVPLPAHLSKHFKDCRRWWLHLPTHPSPTFRLLCSSRRVDHAIRLFFLFTAPMLLRLRALRFVLPQPNKRNFFCI